MRLEQKIGWKMWCKLTNMLWIFLPLYLLGFLKRKVKDSGWNVMTHGEAGEGKWRGNWRMVWVASTLHITSERGLSNITTADVHTSAASSRLN